MFITSRGPWSLVYKEVGVYLSVPELSSAKSALVAATMISQMNVPRFVSIVRIELKRPSKSTSDSPSSLHISASILSAKIYHSFKGSAFFDPCAEIPNNATVSSQIGNSWVMNV